MEIKIEHFSTKHETESFSEFADKHDLQLVLREDKLGRWTAYLEGGSEFPLVADRKGPMPVFGFSRDLVEAVESYARSISCRRMYLDFHQHKEKIRVPFLRFSSEEDKRILADIAEAARSDD